MTLPATALAPCRSEHVLSVHVGDEVVVYDPVGDALHLLDPVAATVWAALDGQTPVDVLGRRLALRAHADERRVIGDVRALLTRLRGTGVVLPGPGPGSRSRSAPAGARRADVPEPDTVDQPPSWAAVGRLPALATPHSTQPFRALRHHFRVVTNLPDVRAWLDTVLVDLGTPAPARDEYVVLDQGPGLVAERYVLGLNGYCVARSGWLARILDLLLWHVNTEAAARSAGAFVLVHAAAAAKGGRAVLLPAPMESGKTTTVAGLVRSGWQYLTDEMVALDPVSLRVLPYPRPMCIDRGSWDVLADLRPRHAERVTGQWQVPASAVRSGAVAPGARPAAVVTPRYRAGADQPPGHVTRRGRAGDGRVGLRLPRRAGTQPRRPRRAGRSRARLPAHDLAAGPRGGSDRPGDGVLRGTGRRRLRVGNSRRASAWRLRRSPAGWTWGRESAPCRRSGLRAVVRTRRGPTSTGRGSR